MKTNHQSYWGDTMKNRFHSNLTALGLATAIALPSAMAFAETLDTLIDYQTGVAPGSWTVWARNSNDNAVCNIGTPSWNSANQNYEIVATFSPGCRYIYYRMAYRHALDGSVALSANVKVDVLSGLAGDAAVSLGYGINYSGFGLVGMTTNPFTYDVSTGGVQALGGEITTLLENHSAQAAPYFALSTKADFARADTDGPVIYIFNNSYGTATPRSLTLRVTVDDVHIQHVGSAWDSAYISAQTSDADSYWVRVQPTFTQLGSDIAATKASIDNLPHDSPQKQNLYNQLETEAGLAIATYNANVSSAQNRSQRVKVPTQEQYDQNVASLDTLKNLLSSGQFVLNLSGPQLVYYSWEATGKNKLNDLSLAVGGGPQQTSKTTLALNELEPVSVVLQNLFEKTVSVTGVAKGTFKNQFGETFPADHIDISVVKNWYTGSDAHIGVLPSDGKVRVPELLLKDDALVTTDDVTKSNKLRIVANGVTSYQDISSPTALMPNGATTNDSTTLKTFSIPKYNAKQLWLTLDTRSAVKPGDYNGNIQVMYRVSGETFGRTLQIPLEFSVAPVQLQASPMLYSLYYRGRIFSSDTAGFQSERKSQQQYLVEMKNMLAHGVTYPTQYLGPDVSELPNYVTLRKQAGLPCDKYFLLDGMATIGTDADTAYSNATQLSSNLGTCNGSSPQLYMYGTDEAVGAALAAEKAAMNRIHVAGAKAFVAGYTGTFAHLHDVLDTLVFYGTPDDAEINAWRDLGKDVYSYGNPQVGVPDPYLYRSHYGLLLWQRNYTGAMNYAYQDGFPGKFGARGDRSGGLCGASTTGYCSLWNDFDSSTYYDHVFTYPTSNGVIDTVQWEGFREAVDDTRYLATLQNMASHSGNTSLVGEINDWLATIKVQANLDPIATRKTIQTYLKMLNLAPTISGTATVSARTISVSGQASDPEGYLAKIEVKLDSGNWKSVGRNSTWQTSFSNVPSGAHVVTYRATDYWDGATTQQSAVTVSAP